MTVTEDEIAEAVRNLYTDTHNISRGRWSLAACRTIEGKTESMQEASELVLSYFRWQYRHG